MTTPWLSLRQVALGLMHSVTMCGRLGGNPSNLGGYPPVVKHGLLENPSLVGFPINTSIYRGFPLAIWGFHQGKEGGTHVFLVYFVHFFGGILSKTSSQRATCPKRCLDA